MCMRMCPLSVEDAEAVLEARRGGRGRALSDDDDFDPALDAYPGSTVPVYVPQPDGSLAVRLLSWGFPLDGAARTVFNTRIESALAQLQRGEGMWARAIVDGRCLVPVRAFYESHGTEKIASEKTGKPVRRPYRFRLPGARGFLLAGIQQDGRFSIITTTPNADVSPVHDRMPLVLGPGESAIWLGPGFADLADRSAIRLSAHPER